MFEEMESILADTLTQEKLWRIAGTRQLDSLTELHIVIDAQRQNVEDLGRFLPSLHTLVLDGSTIPSIRDLGTALQKLHTLSLNAAKVSELDGMSALPSLRELRLQGNDINNLTPLCTHDSLQVLDLRGNPIADLDSLEILGSCTLLYSLDLTETPLEQCCRVHPDCYRPVVMHHIPQLRVLDGTHVTNAERKACLPLPDSVISLAAGRLARAQELRAGEAQQDHAGEGTGQAFDFGGATGLHASSLPSPSTATAAPWEQPLGRPGASSTGRFGSTILARDVSNDHVTSLLDASSDLTIGTDLTFAGAPTSIMRDRRRQAGKVRGSQTGRQVRAGERAAPAQARGEDTERQDQPLEEGQLDSSRRHEGSASRHADRQDGARPAAGNAVEGVELVLDALGRSGMPQESTQVPSCHGHGTGLVAPEFDPEGSPRPEKMQAKRKHRRQRSERHGSSRDRASAQAASQNDKARGVYDLTLSLSNDNAAGISHGLGEACVEHPADHQPSERVCSAPAASLSFEAPMEGFLPRKPLADDPTLVSEYIPAATVHGRSSETHGVRPGTAGPVPSRRFGSAAILAAEDLEASLLRDEASRDWAQDEPDASYRRPQSANAGMPAFLRRPVVSMGADEPSASSSPLRTLGGTPTLKAKPTIDVEAQQRGRRKHNRGRGWLLNDESGASSPFPFSLPSSQSPLERPRSAQSSRHGEIPFERARHGWESGGRGRAAGGADRPGSRDSEPRNLFGPSNPKARANPGWCHGSDHAASGSDSDEESCMTRANMKARAAMLASGGSDKAPVARGDRKSRGDSDVRFSSPPGTRTRPRRSYMDDDTDPEPEDEGALKQSPPKQGLSAAAGIRLGFDLHTSLAAINQWSGDADEDDDDDVDVAPADAHTSQRRGAPVARGVASLLRRRELHEPHSNEEEDIGEALDGDLAAPAESGSSVRVMVQSSVMHSGHKVTWQSTERVAPKVITRDDILAQCSAASAGSTEASTQRPASQAHMLAPERPPTQTRPPGPAVLLEDAALIDMLRKPPKHVSQLRTREGFRQYFSGLSRDRMESLLYRAYADKEPEEREKKLRKRLGLVEDLLV